MDYPNYKCEDFLSDPSFCNYCLQRNPQDTRFWTDWISNHPKKLPEVTKARQLYLMLNGNHDAKQYQTDFAAFKSGFDELLASQITNDPTQEKSAASPKTRQSPLSLKLATFLAIPVFLTAATILFVTKHHPQAAHAAGYSSVSKPGERRNVRLPDGTTVLLNAKSQIEVLPGFGDTTREIRLEGEAFFDVQKDAAHPFIIHTTAMDIRVLGTAFNVKAYPTDKTAEASLLRGSIAVFLKESASRPVVLRPNEKISVPVNHPQQPVAATNNQPALPSVKLFSVEKLTTHPADSLPAEVSWTASCLAFNDNTLEEIVPQLERWYNVSIRFGDDQVRQYRYTATFEKKTITQVLKALSLSRPFAFRWESEGRIIIDASQKKD